MKKTTDALKIMEQMDKEFRHRKAMKKVVYAVLQEIELSHKKHGHFNSSHEGYALLKEEVDEVWDDVKANKLEHSKKEMVQVAAMAIKYIMDVKNK